MNKEQIKTKHKCINNMNKYINKIIPKIINVLKDDLKLRKRKELAESY